MRLKKAALTAFVMISCLYFLQPPETNIYEEDLALRNGSQLTAVFGEDSRISPGETITGYYMDKDTDRPDVNKPYRYIQWELDNTDAYGCPAAFTFSNNAGNLTGAVRSHIRERVGTYYNENFFRPYLEPYVDEDSGDSYDEIDCGFYSLFYDSQRPETGMMFNERIQYEKDILKHAMLNEMKYETVFEEYPVMLSMHSYVRYGNLSGTDRQKKVDILESQLNKMIDAMIQYSGGCLNGSFGITFLAGDGSDATIGYRILKGNVYKGEDYEVDLHQAFFGPIDLDGS